MVGTAVLVFAGGWVAVETGVRVGAGSCNFVGGKSRARKEKGVGAGVFEEPETGINTKPNVLVGTAVICTLAFGGCASAVGTSSETSCTASAAAVLFMLAMEISAVLRILISIAVGGVGLNPAITTISHAIPAQRNSAVKACNGTR
jgi:hypothetical protein